jgi:hypothetical protein
MRKQIENHYLPILQFKNTNLSVQRLEERKYDAILSESPVRYELRVRPWEPGRNSFSGVAEDSVMTIDPHLADHCRLFHFESLLSEWDSLKTSADKFNQECCALTESLTEEIRSSLGLKLMRAWDTPGEYVTPALGLSIYLRMVGLNENPMSAVTQNGQHGQVMSVAFGGQIAAQLKPGTDTAPFQAAVDEAIRRNSAEAEKLRSVARELEQEFERLNGDLKRSLESERLPGNCDYL